MAVHDTIELALPANWLSALMNGDLSSYDSDDLHQITLFARYMWENYGTAIPLSCGDDSYFQKFHDAQHLDEIHHHKTFEVVDVVFPVTKQEEA